MMVLPQININFFGAILAVVFSFLFATVSSRIAGQIGASSNPISGMTVATVLMTSLLFLAVGWTNIEHRVLALSVGGVVCVAAAVAAATSQDLKTGYIVGATPLYQQLGLMIGVTVSALSIGWTTLYLHKVFTIGSAAIAAGLAKGAALADAVGAAKDFISRAIAAADRLAIGSGRGPVHHLHTWW